MAVALFALTFDARSSTGIMLPLLIGIDIVAVWYYHRHTQWGHLKTLLPWMILGVLLGVYFGKDIPEAAFKQLMAGIILFSVFFILWISRSNYKVPQSKGFGIVMGLSAGFTTMIGNLAGAFSNVYFLAMRLPKDQFIGTAAWLFFLINLFKLPFHIWVWHTITLDSFTQSIVLFPAVVLGFIIGIKIVKRIKSENYRLMILLLTTIGAIMVFFK